MMPPKVKKRRSLRLPGYDYSLTGAYFITVCTQRRQCLFGEIIAGEMRLNAYGGIVKQSCQDLPVHYPGILLDLFIVMPNHLHAIIFIQEVGAGFKPAPTIVRGKPLSEIVRGLKTFSARKINGLRQTPGVSVWQRNYYEHIIRNEESLNRIREYIATNPLRWGIDRENPGFTGMDEFDVWLNAVTEPVGAGLKPAPTRPQ